jgi:hypothetical protein
MRLSQFQLTYELCPIILEGGIAGNIPGSQLGIISLTQAQDFANGLLSSGDLQYEDFIAHFSPMPGSTLIENQVGMYPFANQQVAANAIIAQPLKLSMMMTAPVSTDNGYGSKLASFTSLQQTLSKHSLLGGTFTVATPAMYYTEMLLLGIRDATGGDTKQVQVQWQWDFVKPLLTQAQASQALSGLLNKMTNGTQIPGDPIVYSGTAPGVSSPSSGVAPPLVPAARQAGASSVSVGNQSSNNVPI